MESWRWGLVFVILTTLTCSLTNGREQRSKLSWDFVSLLKVWNHRLWSQTLFFLFLTDYLQTQDADEWRQFVSVSNLWQDLWSGRPEPWRWERGSDQRVWNQNDLMSGSLFLSSRVTSSVFLTHRSDHVVGVHGGSSERRVGHEPAEAGCKRHRLGHPESWESTVTLRPGGLTAHVFLVWARHWGIVDRPQGLNDCLLGASCDSELEDRAAAVRSEGSRSSLHTWRVRHRGNVSIWETILREFHKHTLYVFVEEAQREAPGEPGRRDWHIWE